jgi:hypothetical protein
MSHFCTHLLTIALFSNYIYILVNTGQKIAMTIKKHNVNLPSLTKNSKSQTMADYGGRVSRDRPAKVLYP